MADLTIRQKRWIFAAFAIGILFSMVREWSAPVMNYCIRPTLERMARLAR